MADIDKFGDEELLARTLWGEARSEGEDGMQAIACVVLNRVKNPRWWGTDVQSVLKKPYQFSCWNKSDKNRPKLMAVTEADHEYKLALKIAGDALAGYLYDCTNDADSYRVAGTYAYWAEGLSPVAVIGKHEFYDTRSGKPVTNRNSSSMA